MNYVGIDIHKRYSVLAVQVVEWDGSGNLQAWNVYGPGPDEILCRYQSGIGHMRYHQDIHGNVTALLDWGGNLVEKYSYDAFGRPNVTNSDGSGARTWSNWGNPFMFTGREYFPGLWLYDYRHRWYDAQLGRFLQTDPTGFDAGDMNLFRYCDDDPVDRSDPMGLIDSNNFDPNTVDYKWAERASLSMYPDLFTYGAHGGDHDYNYGQALNPAYRSSGRTIPLQTVITSIKGNPIFAHKSGTLLLVCNSGADGSTFARSVATGTGKDVLAPNKYLWLLDQKKHPFVVAGGYRDRRTGELKMNKDDPGHLTRFFPDGTSRAGADFQISQRDANNAVLVTGGSPQKAEPESSGDGEFGVPGGTAGISHPPIQFSSRQ